MFPCQIGSMEEVKHENLDGVAGGTTETADSAKQYTISFKVKVYQGSTWRNTFPYTYWDTDFVSRIKASIADTYRLEDKDQVHLYKPDGTEITGGSIGGNGIVTNDVLTAVF